MRSDYSLWLMHLRFKLARNACMIATALAWVAVVLLPKNHPSRIYLAGRTKRGREAIVVALSKQAAEATL